MFGQVYESLLIRANPFNPCPKNKIRARIQVMHVLHELPGVRGTLENVQYTEIIGEIPIKMLDHIR